MDPISALSIAAAVVQFIQFSGSLVSKTRSLRHSAQGQLPENIESETATSRLVELAGRLKDSLCELPKADQIPLEAHVLDTLCNDCIKVSEELLARLDKLRVHEAQSHRKWKSFRQALRAVWSKAEIDAIACRLEKLRADLDSQLIFSVRTKVNALEMRQEKGFTQLEENIQWTLQTLLDTRGILNRDRVEQTDSLKISNFEEHAKTRATILAAIGGEKARLIEESLLQSLRFPSMRDRREEIFEAHCQTFEWIFADESCNMVPWSNFVRWLQDPSDCLYWVNGKAGSGKSTLMRYILDSPKISEYLRLWSGDSELEIAGFFFWNSGSREQRSQMGLFRSLLYETLRKRPNLVRHIFPHEWADGYSIVAQRKPLDWEWSLATLKMAFTRLTDYENSSVKLCFFIDGLDEYEGDHDDIAEFFKSITSPYLKMCVSSRPWLVFEEAFRDFSGIQLQDLTFKDIQAYVRAELERNRMTVQLAKAEPQHASELVNEIVLKANGVFLWVRLVVRSLLVGLRNYDDISDLRRRLISLPSDLGLLYTHMLSHVDSIYKEQASRTFQIYHAMMKMEDGLREITALELELAITALEKPRKVTTWEVMRDDEISLRCERMDVHLKSRCAGLPEIHDRRKGLPPSETIFDCKEFLKVVYLHRTVKDFLETDDVQSIILQHTAKDPSFEPNTVILMSYITRLKKSVCLYDDRPESRASSVNGIWITVNQAMKSAREVSDTRNRIWATVHQAMKFAREASDTGNLAHIPILDELDEAATRLWNAPNDPWQRGLFPCKGYSVGHWADYGKPKDQGHNFLSETINWKLAPYIETKLKADRAAVVCKSGVPLLSYALQSIYSVRNDIVELILQHGADPNQPWDGESLWQNNLRRFHGFHWDSLVNNERINILIAWAETFRILIRHGASLCSTCSGKHRGYKRAGMSHPDPQTVTGVITDIFGRWLPYASAELIEFVQEQSTGKDLSSSVVNTHSTTFDLSIIPKSKSEMKRRWSGEVPPPSKHRAH